MRMFAVSLLAVILMAIVTTHASAGEWGFSYQMDHGPSYGHDYGHYHHDYHPPVRHYYVEPPCHEPYGYEPYGYAPSHYYYRPAYRPPVHHHYRPYGHYHAPRPSIHLSFGH